MKCKGHFSRANEIEMEKITLDNLDECSLISLGYSPEARAVPELFLQFLVHQGLLMDTPVCEQHGIAAELRRRNDIGDGVKV